MIWFMEAGSREGRLTRPSVKSPAPSDTQKTSFHSKSSLYDSLLLSWVSPRWSGPADLPLTCPSSKAVHKNPAYGRHQISRPMRIEALIPMKYAFCIIFSFCRTQKGRPTPHFSIFIRSFVRPSVRLWDQILVPTHSLRDKGTWELGNSGTQ